MEKKNIVVTYGGKSVEHDISILTFLQVMKNIDREKYNIYPIYIDKQSRMFLNYDYENKDKYKTNNFKNEVTFLNDTLYKKTKFGFKKVEKIDVALLCNHGTNVEDGTLQGYFEHLNIPYTGSNVMSSSINMDKIVMKQILIQNDFPCADYVYFYKKDYEKHKTDILKEIEDSLNYPVIVKPANLGSSIGITRCKTKKALKEAIEIAGSYDTKILVEEVVLNLREINCAILGNKNEIITSKLEEPYGWEDFLDFDEKYIKNGHKTTNINLDETLKEKIYSLAINAFKTMDCSGVVRIDFLLNDKSKEVFVNELNTLPGSLAYYLFDDKMTFSEVIDKLILIAIENKKEKDALIFNFSSKALDKMNNIKTRK